MLTMKVYCSKYYSPLFQNGALAPLQIPTSLCEGPIYLLSCWEQVNIITIENEPRPRTQRTACVLTRTKHTACVLTESTEFGNTQSTLCTSHNWLGFETHKHIVHFTHEPCKLQVVSKRTASIFYKKNKYIWLKWTAVLLKVIRLLSWAWLSFKRVQSKHPNILEVYSFWS